MTEMENRTYRELRDYLQDEFDFELLNIVTLDVDVERVVKFLCGKIDEMQKEIDRLKAEAR